MQEARKAFRHHESSGKLKRALWYNTRTCNKFKLLYEDSVYYKRNSSKQRNIPGR